MALSVYCPSPYTAMTRDMGIKRARMFDGHDGRWKKGKSMMRLLFDTRSMSDDEYMACQGFVVTVMGESDLLTDNFESHVAFQRMR